MCYWVDLRMYYPCVTGWTSGCTILVLLGGCTLPHITTLTKHGGVPGTQTVEEMTIGSGYKPCPTPNPNLLFQAMSGGPQPYSPGRGAVGGSSAEWPPGTVISTWSYSTVKLEWLK